MRALKRIARFFCFRTAISSTRCTVPMPQLALVDKTIPLLPILPLSVRQRLSGRSVGSERMPVVSLPPAIKRFIRTPERIGVADFAAKYRTVTDGAHVGRWRHEYAPYAKKIMDTFGHPWVREVWFLGVDQSSKTNTMLNCMAWAIEQSPGNIFYLMPNEADRDKITGGKIKPMLSQSPRLASYLSPRKDDASLSRIFLKNGISIFPAHAHSAGSMASWSAKHCFCDEVDLYPDMVGGKDVDPITQIGRRNRTYSGRYKRFFASTPRGKFIHAGVYGNQKKGLPGCHQVWLWHNRCPHCGQLIAMDSAHLLLAEQATMEQIDLHGCEYGCQSCGAVITEADRQSSIKAGAWVCIKGSDVARPEKVGFHHNAWGCLDVSLREIATAYLKSQSGNLSAKIAYANGIEAIDYEHVQQDRAEDWVSRLEDEHLPRKSVPANTAALLLLVDTQKFGFRYQVWAVGYGQTASISVIDRGFVKSFDNIGDIAARNWLDASGLQHRILTAWIDSGGGTDPHNPKHSRTREVYRFCKLNPIFQPLKGRREQAQPWGLTRLEYLPSRSGNKTPIPGGLSLYTINVTLYKGELATLLNIEPGDPGCLRLFSGIGSDYGKQMCAEYRDERGYWICPRGKDNHDWDISVYGLAAIDIMGIRDWVQDAPSAESTAINQQVTRPRMW